MRRHLAHGRAVVVTFAAVDFAVVIAPAVVLALAARKGGLSYLHGADLVAASAALGLGHAALTYRRLTDEARMAKRRVDAWLAELDALVVLAVAATTLLVAVLGGLAEEHGVLVNQGWPVIALWTGVQVVAIVCSEVTSRAVFRWLETSPATGAVAERGVAPEVEVEGWPPVEAVGEPVGR